MQLPRRGFQRYQFLDRLLYEENKITYWESSILGMLKIFIGNIENEANVLILVELAQLSKKDYLL